MLIDFQVVPHSEQRYPTVGDWWWDKIAIPGMEVMFGPGHYDEDMLHIRVSKMSDPRYELLVFHHELTEALVCREKGITAELVDAWDTAYENARHDITPASMLPCSCRITETSEPGDDPHAPYHHAHALATACEMLMAANLGVNWDAYAKEVESL